MEYIWLAEFERKLNLPAPTLTFTVAIPCTDVENDSIRLRFIAGDPVVMEIMH